MGHCVGGYCPDVVEGRSKIYSLRDDKGRPHVTIEVQPGKHLDYNGWFKKQPENVQNRIAERRLADPDHNIYEGPEYLAAREAIPPDIVQIKGKGNRAPVEEYLPAVQDFVKSGKWSNVGDLQNTGLTLTSDRLGDLKKYQDMGIDVPEYTNQDDINKIIELAYPAKPVKGFAEGGAVSGANFPTGDFDPARIDSIVGELHAMNAR